MTRAGRGALAALRRTLHPAAGLAVCAALSVSRSGQAFEPDPRAEERRCPAADGACPEPGTAGGALLGDPLQVLVGPGFALLRGGQAVAEAACAAQPIATAALADAVERSERQLGIDAQLGIVLSRAAPSCNSIYYVPLANDVRGIGYGHLEPHELFDDSPGSGLEGVAFLNDWPYWRAHADEFRGAFHHEVAHRWGARVQLRLDGSNSNELLGRGLSHWSYFLDTRGSPHEGNLWVADASGQHTETPPHGSQFSPLDSYLMGVGLPEDVPPFDLLRAPQLGALDCRSQPLSPASPPQTCGSLALRAEPLSVKLQDILAVEGPREPAASVEPRSVTALAIVVDSPRAAFSAEDCRELSSVLAQRFADFERATRGRLRLVQLLAGAGDCEDAAWEVPPEPAVSAATSLSGGCNLSLARPSTRRPAEAESLAALALFGLLRLAIRASKPFGAGLRSRHDQDR